MMEKLMSRVSHILFVLSFVFAAFAVWEKLANMFGYTLLRIYSPGRFLEFSAIALIFVIAIQLREIKLSIKTEGSK